MQERELEDYVIKVILLGAAGVGKTSLMEKFCRNQFNENQKATLGVQFMTGDIRVHVRQLKQDKMVKLQVWDTAGQERYRAITAAYYRGADAALYVFSLEDEKTLEALRADIREVRAQNRNRDIHCILVGNKVDTGKRGVTPVQVQAFMTENQLIDYVETSAKDGTMVVEAFSSVTRRYVTEAMEDILRMEAPKTEKVKLGALPSEQQQQQQQQQKRTGCSC